MAQNSPWLNMGAIVPQVTPQPQPTPQYIPMQRPDDQLDPKLLEQLKAIPNNGPQLAQKVTTPKIKQVVKMDPETVEKNDDDSDQDDSQQVNQQAKAQQESDLEGQLNKMYLNQVQQSQTQQSQAQNDLNNIGQRPQGLAFANLSPLAQLVGLKDYQAPTAIADYDKRKQLLQAAAEKTNENTGKQLLDYMKMKEDAKLRQQMEQMKLQGMLWNHDIQGQRLGLQTDRAVNQTMGAFDNNPLMRNYQNADGALQRGMNRLNSPVNGIVTGQMIKEVSNEIANALQNGGNSASNDREAQEYHNAATRWASMMSNFKDMPEGVASPELVNYLKNNLQALRQDFGGNISRLAGTIASGRKYQNKALNDALQTRMNSYQQQAQDMQSSQGSGPSGAMSFDQWKASQKK